ncbi:hypothetical protein D5086_015481 [Populus alba]|uniref:Uncharacterized protein n=1 Tax=Populus alba TaxID=43335 RepID=A0ACC4BRM1_POPAL
MGYFPWLQSSPAGASSLRHSNSRRFVSAASISSIRLAENLSLFLPIAAAPGVFFSVEATTAVKSGNYKATTKYIQGTLAPIWNQVFAFNKDRLQAKNIEISVRGKVSVTNEIIGSIEVGIGDIPTRLQGDSSMAPQWYGLEDKNGVSGRSGNLMLAIWVGNQVDDAFSLAWHLDAASVSVDKVSNARTQVYYSPRLWYLKIKVNGAQDLVVSDPNRKPEVYVKATLGNKRLLPPLPSEEIISLERYGVVEGPMEKFSRKVGDLELGILKAEGLVPMKSKNGLKTTDAYCVAKYGPKWTRTSTVVSSLEPKWMKQYQWDVLDPCTVIAIGVFDNNNLQAGEGWATDRLIGKVIRIRLSTLEFGRIYKYAYPLVALMPDGVMKMGELHFTLRFIYTKGSGDKMYQYTQPLLPKPAYTNPMSVYQIDSLRNQAVRHIAMRLARAEPPLRREVVESMLSGRGPVWSIRRGKANFQRVMECLKFFKTALIWLDDLRQWKNSRTTIVMFAVFSVFVYYSEIIIPSFFAFLFLKALRNYFKRPRDILCLDTNLSQVESVNTLDWQEELDTFPSSAPFEDLRLRYDRLRAIGYRIEETVGDLATQLERFHAMFSWRDRRATLIFTLFCLVAWMVFYLVPFRLLFFLFGTYLMRSPRFRVTLPPIPQNVFRRLPSRDDCLL